MFAVDAGSTQGVAQVMEQSACTTKASGAGGYDLLGGLKLIKAGHMDFTSTSNLICKASSRYAALPLQHLGRRNGPAETNTGLIFITPGHGGPLPRDLVALRGGLRSAERS